MSLINLLVLLAVVGLVLQVTYYWGRIAFVLALLGGALLVWSAGQVSDNSIDILTVTLALEPAPRGFLTLAFALTSALALATSLQRDRVSLAFLFWSWIPWLVALVVSDFVVAVFAWGMGLTTTVLAMKPRQNQRASGAAYFLVFVGVATASLLLANRFIVLYPLTPERTSLIDLAVLFLAWGLGLSLALFPFHFWIGPLTDDAPLPVSAMLLGLGQPIGIWLLFRLLAQYSWLVDKSNLFELIGLAGAATALVAGLMIGLEQRAGRLVGYAAMFALGLGLLDVSRATREGLTYFGVELTSRALSLTVLACAILLNRSVEEKWVQRVSLLAFLLAGLNLIGIRLGPSLLERWTLASLVGTDDRLLGLLVLAHIGVLVGIVRFAQRWPLLREQWLDFELEAEIPVRNGFERRDKPAPAARVRATASVEPLVVESAAPGGVPVEASQVQLASQESTPARGNHGAAPDGEEEEVIPPATEEYVFEEHVREILRTAVARGGPHVQRAARSIPRGVGVVVGTIWRTWPVWGSLALLVVLIAALLALVSEPQLLFNHIVSLIGQPPFVQ